MLLRLTRVQFSLPEAVFWITPCYFKFTPCLATDVSRGVTVHVIVSCVICLVDKKLPLACTA